MYVHLDELRYATHFDTDVPHATAVRQMDCARILIYKQYM